MDKGWTGVVSKPSRKKEGCEWKGSMYTFTIWLDVDE